MRSGNRFPIALTLAVALALPVLIALGVWQLQRLQWKRDLLARIEAARNAPARPLQVVLEEARESGASADFRRAVANCPGLASAPFVELHSIVEGQAGTRLISPCVTPAGTLLIDRGFVAAEISARPPAQAVDDVLAVTGVLRGAERPGPLTPAPSRGRFFSRDIAAMAVALKAPRPLPYMLVAETSSNPEWQALRPAALPGQISNNHLGYALTWFGLAAALVGVYLAMLRAWWRREP